MRWIFELIEQNDKIIGALSSIAVAAFTGTLWWSTRRLWRATKQLADDAQGIAERQSNETRILQRAYLSFKPLGIKPFTSGSGQFSCDVLFENVGKLPARKVKWFIDRVFSGERYLKNFAILQDRFEGDNVIPPGTGMRKGGKAIDWESFQAGRGRIGDSWLYVWGEVRYDDGFENTRFTKFCHRYNFAGIPRQDAGGGVTADNARYHVYGNDAD